MDDHQTFAPPSPERRVYCSRTLNLRSIDAIGYDMDYTLVHYRVETWEQLSYLRLKELLAADGWPVESLEFDPDLVVRGLVIDVELGNIVKANRFGYVMRSFHGTRPMAYAEQREVYRHTPVDLSESRFIFLNTLFSLSASCLYAQLVDLYDEQGFPDIHGYRDLFRRVGERMDEAHVEGTLKARIVADPDRYVELDPEVPLALLDQQRSGKRLMLISNAEWRYARDIMAYAFDRYLPGSMTWRDLFELVIVAARKPDFFDRGLPLFRIVDENGLLQPVAGPIAEPGLYLGGDASKVESYLGVSGAQILYVGDHIWADVHMSKSALRWRTALILRELEDEVSALESYRPAERELVARMAEKAELEARLCAVRLQLQRVEQGYGPRPTRPARKLAAEAGRLRERLETLDGTIVPLARRSVEVLHPEWGPLLRAGNDKSHLAHQVERSADVYTSRVSNLLHVTPFAYLRSSRGSMPHDPNVVAAPHPPDGLDPELESEG